VVTRGDLGAVEASVIEHGVLGVDSGGGWKPVAFFKQFLSCQPLVVERQVFLILKGAIYFSHLKTISTRESLNKGMTSVDANKPSMVWRGTRSSKNVVCR
jgi:hypothetical protein